MKAMVADDELLALSNINSIVSKNSHIEACQAFSDSTKAMEFVQTNDVDVVFLDIEMGAVSGMDIAKVIRAKSKTTYIVFTSGYDFAIDALGAQVKANGYLLKPYESSQVDFEIQCAYDQLISYRAKLKSEDSAQTGFSKSLIKRVRFQTIPRFDMFVDNRPVPITTAKSKEFLALLVDRKGSSLTLDYIVSILWEDKPIVISKNYFRVVLQRLNAILKDYQLEDLIIHSKNQYSLNTDLVTCDYYDILNGDKKAMDSFVGEYMSEYEWSEDTCAVLFRLTDPTGAKGSQ